MKKLFVVLQLMLFVFAPLYAKAPWGTWEDWYDGPPKNTVAPKQEVTYSRFKKQMTITQNLQRRGKRCFARADFLTKAMDGSVKIWIRYKGYNPDEETRAQYEEMVSQAIQSWFEQAAEMIEDKGRQEEFGEVYQILEKGIEVSFAQEAEGDVNVIFYDDPAEMKKHCYGNIDNCAGVFSGKNVHVVRIGEFNNKEVLQTRLTHEFGHAFGLTDQYDVIQERADYSLRYGSPEESKDSIMNTWAKIGPDDVDGIINVIDLELLAQGKPGIPDSWVGFTEKYVYLHGEWREYNPEREGGPFEEAAPGGMENFIIEETWREEGIPSWNIKIYQWIYHIEQLPEEKVSQETVYLSALNDSVNINEVMEKPLTMEKEVTPFSITPGKGPNQESVTCYDRYRKTVCFGGTGNKTMWVQRFERAPHKQGDGGKRWMNRKLYFRTTDVFVEMTWKYDDHLNPVAFLISERKLEDPFPLFSATLEPEGRILGKPLVLTIKSENQEPFFLSPGEDIETQMQALLQTSSAEILTPFKRR